MSNPFLETVSWRTQTDRELRQSSTPSHASPASFLSLYSVAPRAFLTFPPNATLAFGSASWGISLQKLLRKGLHCCTVLILLSHFFLSSHSSLSFSAVVLLSLLQHLIYFLWPLISARLCSHAFPWAHGEMFIHIFLLLLMDILNLPLWIVTVLLLQENYSVNEDSSL